MSRRKRAPQPAAKTPTPPDLVLDPELAVLSILAHVLDIASSALLAEHPTLIDDLRNPHDDGPVVSLASTLCRRASALANTLAAYDRAVRAAAASRTDADQDLPF
jgi:hypothetical protein